MRDVIVIYEGSPESTRAFAEILDSRQIRSLVEDHHQYSTRTRAAVATHSSLSVATDDLENAAAERDAWLAGAERRVQGHLGRVATVISLSLVPVAGWLLFSLASQGSVPFPTLARGLVAWFLSVILAARWEDHRHRKKQTEWPAWDGRP
jgi:hypothetical protein